MFLYYISGQKTISEKEAIAVGLPHVAESSSFSFRGTTNGPDGKGGCVFASFPAGMKNLPRVGYYPDKQTWHDFGKYQIGIEKDNPPVPESLAREKQVPGHLVKLAHGEWLIPCARHFFPEYGSPLPKVFALGPDGKMAQEPDPCYAELCRGADELWYWFCKDFGMEEYLGDMPEPQRPSMEARFDFAALSLAVNYRVTTAELLFLRELTTETLLNVEKAVFDWQSVVAFSETVSKKNSASTPDGSGSEDTSGAS